MVLTTTLEMRAHLLIQETMVNWLTVKSALSVSKVSFGTKRAVLSNQMEKLSSTTPNLTMVSCLHSIATTEKLSQSSR
jgi:hypothetical protein